VPSAMNTEPPTPEKLRLVREFLVATGLQDEIDQARFLDRYQGRVRAALPTTMTYGAWLGAPAELVQRAYKPHRQIWQEEYESHVHWEFSEGELAEAIRFFGGEAGRHFREGLFRLRAYVGSNTEDLVEQVIAEAERLATQNGLEDAGSIRGS
jgi:hypothetical protein